MTICESSSFPLSPVCLSGCSTLSIPLVVPSVEVLSASDSEGGTLSWRLIVDDIVVVAGVVNGAGGDGVDRGWSISPHCMVAFMVSKTVQKHDLPNLIHIPIMICSHNFSPKMQPEITELNKLYVILYNVIYLGFELIAFIFFIIVFTLKAFVFV